MGSWDDVAALRRRTGLETGPTSGGSFVGAWESLLLGWLVAQGEDGGFA